MTDNPFVYGVELREPPVTGPSATSQYDLLFHQRASYQRSHAHSLATYYGQYYAAERSSNLSDALGDILRENISLIVDTYNYTAGGGPLMVGPGGAASPEPAQTNGAGGARSAGDSPFQNQLIIPLYATIFLLSVVGNLLVILTLAQNKRMRTVTNVYLLNLAISDLLLGVFCMPFTLAGQVLRRFVFGGFMCKLIPYFQAVSVSVAVWTLVAISLERYFAICRPLSSRRWQTQFHAYKMIGLVWIVSFLANSPLCYVQRLQPVLRTGRSNGPVKCREVWPDRMLEKAYVLFHDAGLLFLPLLTMGFAYSMIVSKLWRGLRHEIKHSSLYQQSSRQCSAGHGTPGASGGVPGVGHAAAAGSVVISTGPPGGAYSGTSGGEAHPHSSGTGNSVGGAGGGGVKRHETSPYLHPSSMKKSLFKPSSTATVNFAGNTGPSYHSTGSGNGHGTGAASAPVGGSGGHENASHAASASGTSMSVMECEICDKRTGRLRSFRHFFAKRHRGGLGRNQRYHLGSRSPEGLPELAETKFDECRQSPTHQQPQQQQQQQQQHGYHHHYHHHPSQHHLHHAYHHLHHLHHHHQHRMPGDAKHELGASGEPTAHEQRLLLPGATSNTGATATGTDGPSGPGTGPAGDPTDDGPLKSDPSYQFSRHAIRSTYMDKSIEAKKKVIRMLFVIIVEFFVCWAPLHILNTVYIYSPSFFYQYVNSSGIALVQLMAYISSCCNPITYCFMNRRFRQAFLAIFSCHRNRMPLCCCPCCASKKVPQDGVECKSAAFLRQNAVNHSGAERNNSDLSGNDSLLYVGRGIVQRSEILILESEDRV